MSYIGDFALGVTFDTKFTSRAFSTGAPTTLAGTPVISAYVDNSTTQLTAGITLSVDFDGVTGLHNIRVVATSGNGYAAGSNYQLVITTGTVGGVSVVGEVVAEFSIENRSALRPTVAARTLDVTATGAAGIDWANVENPTTALNLSGTNIDPDQVVASVTGAVGSVTGAVGSVTGNVGGNVNGNVVGNVNGNVVGTVASVVGNVGGNVVGNVNGNVVGSVASVVGNVGGNVVGSVASVVGNVGGNVVGSVASVVGNVGGNVVGTVAAVVGNVGGSVLGDVVGDIGGDLLGDVQGNVDGSVGSVVGLNPALLDAAVSTRATPAQVNAEVLDVLSVDTFAEPTGVPPATDTIANKIGRNYQALRNRIDVDSNTGKKQFFNDAGAALWEKDFTDAGNVYSETEGNAP